MGNKKKKKIEIKDPHLNFDASYSALRQIFDRIDVQPDVGANELLITLTDIHRISKGLMEYVEYEIEKNKKGKK